MNDNVVSITNFVMVSDGMAEDHITLKKSTYQKILVGIVLLLVALSFSAGYLVANNSQNGLAVNNQIPQQQIQQNAQPQQNVPAGRVSVSLDDDPVIGDNNAKVTVIEFSDFQCPFCGRAFEQSVTQLKEEYVNTGKVRFVYRDFPLDSIHPQARPAANAAQCAAEQGKFWEYHDVLFQNQNQLSTDNYKIWAADLKLNTDTFNTCLSSNKYDSEISKDFQDGANAGVSGTPTFYIGSPEKGYIELVGAQPYSTIKETIEQELAN